MAISLCEYCGKPFNSFGAKLCAACSKEIEDTYVKARKYIYQNSKKSDFRSIVESTEVSEKALSYLINKGRIEIANKNGVGLRCRACGKETSGGTLCDACKAKLLTEKMTEKITEKTEEEHKKPAEMESLRKKILPTSFSGD